MTLLAISVVYKMFSELSGISRVLLSDNSGLVVVLDNFFGRNFKTTGSVGYSLHIQGSGGLTDTKGYLSSHEDLTFGVRHGLTINSRERQATANFDALDLEARNCYNTGERKLKLRQPYGVFNCLIDIMIQHALKMCDCLPWVMARNPIIQSAYGNTTKVTIIIVLHEVLAFSSYI